MSQTISGVPVYAHYLAVFNEKQELLGEALKLDPPARIELQIVGHQRGFQLFMPREVIVPLTDPHMMGVAFFNVEKKFLCAFSFAGNPEGRTGTEAYTIRSRYIIMAVRQKTTT